jgi:polyisoprenoid-binding protein YceI
MSRALSLGFASALVLAATPVLASEWTIDADHSKVGFSVPHMMVSETEGTFDKYEGTIIIDDKDITKSKIDVSFDIASVNTRSKKRDEHLASPEFFDAAKHPKMTFKSTKIEKEKSGQLKVTGNLTIKGVTKPVVLLVDGPTAEKKDPWGGTHIGFKGTTQINREDFGLTWNKALEGGGVLVGKEVKIDLVIELLKKEAAPAKK